MGASRALAEQIRRMHGKQLMPVAISTGRIPDLASCFQYFGWESNNLEKEPGFTPDQVPNDVTEFFLTLRALEPLPVGPKPDSFGILIACLKSILHLPFNALQLSFRINEHF